MRLVQALLDRNVRVYSTRGANRDIPRDLKGEGKRLKKGKSAFRRNGLVLGVGGRLWLSEDQRQVKEQVAWLSDSTRTARVVAV